MKSKLLIMFSFLFVSKLALAQYFPARAQVLVLPGAVSAEVFNPYYEPIVCNGQVFGRTYVGLLFTSYFVEQILMAGAYRTAVVTADIRDPFVGGWSAINCRFLRW